MDSFTYQESTTKDLFHWWQSLGDTNAGIEITSCLVGHFRMEEDGTFTALPQCKDALVTFNDGRFQRLYEGDVIEYEDGIITIIPNPLLPKSRDYAWGGII